MRAGPFLLYKGVGGDRKLVNPCCGRSRCQHRCRRRSAATTWPTWMGAWRTTLSSAATTSAIWPLGTGLEVLTGQRGVQAALGADGAGDDAGGVGQLFLAVGDAVGAAVAGYFIVVGLIHLQMAALAGSRCKLLLSYRSCLLDLNGQLRPREPLSSRTLGRAMCSISPGARRSRLKRGDDRDRRS